jgi:Peptidase family M28
VSPGRACLQALAVAACLAAAPAGAASDGGTASFAPRDLKEWLTYISSDDLQGRAVFSSGLGLAASYLEQHLRAWGVKPAGDNGSYFQAVKVLGVKGARHSTVTVTVAGERRTFADGDAVRFPRNTGGKQSLTVDRVEFTGYGLDSPRAGHVDYRGLDMSGAATVWLGADGPGGPAAPGGFDPAANRLLLAGRGRYAIEEMRAAASIGVAVTGGGRRGQNGDGAAATQTPAPAGGRNAIPAADFTTVERLDHIKPPQVTGTDAFFEFLFSRAPVKYGELKRKAEAREALPEFRLEGVTLTFDVNTDYEVVRTQLTQNVVAMVEGSDPQLKQSYVAFGAHYDHVGYAEGELTTGAEGTRRAGSPGRITSGAEADRIWNGADDDGSGTVTLLAMARAFALGPRPKRSVLFVWHAGEERGRWGSLYFADNAPVDLERIVAQLNIDMVGRNRDNKTSESNTLYLVGSDRISTELDQIAQAANLASQKPLHLDYEFNDPADPEQLYTRSDHYSYAARGIPVIFFTTGLHPDYHANTDEVSKIEFDKLSRVGEFIYATGWRLASLDHAPARDRQGARQGVVMAPLTR